MWEKLRIKWREFWRLEGLELVGGKYLCWIRVLKKQEKNRKGYEALREKNGENAGTWGRRVLECWGARVLGCGSASVGISTIEELLKFNFL